jgi:ParB family chromosome partitioning protein
MNRGKKERLGRGLEALLGDFMDEQSAPDSTDIKMIPVNRIRPNPFQPRKEFAEEELESLSKSIRENGLLQPLLVRPSPETQGGWELVAGERRLRAVTRLEWPEVACWVREVEDRTLLVLALVENLQRESLGALEEAEGYRVLSDSFGLTQGEIADAVGKDRSTVANTLRLLQLPVSIKRLLLSGSLTAGHVRPFLTMENQTRASDLAKKAAEEGWSVRRVEEAVKGLVLTKQPKPSPRHREKDPVFLALEEELRKSLATRVVVKRTSGEKGVIEVPFLSTEDFERIFALLTGHEASEVVE